ncbi:hypothetical protein [uncultured Arthrobacter sp.]|uniref:hypothetical protein n=1 Tax=uncultured Arthrobacter sp. TaxID=114050 RepID=UPI00261F63D3|nr:hypothetical protein [uncultured Arthrobacter sp.]
MAGASAFAVRTAFGAGLARPVFTIGRAVPAPSGLACVRSLLAPSGAALPVPVLPAATAPGIAAAASAAEVFAGTAVVAVITSARTTLTGETATLTTRTTLTGETATLTTRTTLTRETATLTTRTTLTRETATLTTRTTLTGKTATLTGWSTGTAFGAILVARTIARFRGTTAAAALCAVTGATRCITTLVFVALIVVATVLSAVAEGFPISHGSTIPLVMS